MWIAVPAVIELIKFVMTAQNLKGKTAEEVLDMWAATRLDVRKAVDDWRNTPAPPQPPRPDA